MRLHAMLGAAALWAVVPFAGCTSESRTEAGSASIVLTDAGLDDVDTFEVDITGVEFRKLSGDRVSVLSKRARVDFTELETISDLVARATLEAGIYRDMTVTFDFSTASVYLTGKTTAATLVDSKGATITGAVVVPISFAAGSRPRILPNKNHVLQLDLDLTQAVNADLTNNKITLVPAFTVELDPTNPKPVTATGILASVDAASKSFVVEKRTPQDQKIGEFTVQASDSTVFQISGQVLSGSFGIAGLANLTLGTSRVFVQGVIDASSGKLNATAVESGAGTPGNGQDWVAGWIVTRTGGAGANATLTVLGRSRKDSTGSRTFNTSHTVSVEFGTTKVLRRGAGNSLSTDTLNVGQHVVAFGTLAGTALDSTSATGVVRMGLSDVYGTVTSAPANNTMTINVSRFGARPISAFDFSVGGNDEADPSNFVVDVTGLTLSDVETGSRLRVRGWTNAVGIPTDANFAAQTVVNRSNEAKLLFSNWFPPQQADAILTSTGNQLSVDVANATSGFVYDGFSSTALTASPRPTIAPAAAVGIYRILQSGSVELHFDFEAFGTSLASRATGTTKVVRVTGLGRFDATTQAMQAGVVTVVLQ